MTFKDKVRVGFCYQFHSPRRCFREWWASLTEACEGAALTAAIFGLTMLYFLRTLIFPLWHFILSPIYQAFTGSPEAFSILDSIISTAQVSRKEKENRGKA